MRETDARSPAIVRARLIAAILLSAWTAPVTPATESVWEALRTPGAVVVLRHSDAPGGFDPPDARLDDRSTRRNLDETGRARARRIGVTDLTGPSMRMGDLVVLRRAADGGHAVAGSLSIE
jgi:hypothetical protein